MRNNRMRPFTSKLITAFLVAGLVCGMTGCTSEKTEEKTSEVTSGTTSENTDEAADITMSDLVKANSRDALLEKYDSVYAQSQGDYRVLYGLYVSKDFAYQEYEDSETLVDADDNWLYTDVNGKDTLVYDWYAMSDEDRAAGIMTPESFADPIVNEEYTSLETIEDIKDNGDGTITIITQLPAEEMSSRLKEDNQDYPEEFYSSPQKSTYVLDKESLEIISCEQVILADSGEIPFISYTVTHDASQPETMQTMLSLIDEFKNSDKEESRTIKIIYDYGTDQEEEYEITVDNKFMVRPFYRDGYDYIYTDPEKKEEYTGGDGVSDLTMYAFTDDKTE